MNKDAERIHPFSKRWFFWQADELYSLTRFAYFAGLMNVTFRNAHHALEYYLKASLADQIPLSDLKRQGHNLTKLYKRFSALFSITPVGIELIGYIDRFNKMRYPIESGFTKILWGMPLDEFFSRFEPHLRERVACFSIKDLDQIVFEIREKIFPLSDIGLLTVSAEQESFLYRDNMYFRPPCEPGKARSNKKSYQRSLSRETK